MRLLRSAEKPLAGSAVAQAARAADPTLGTTSWDGNDSFFAWLEAGVPRRDRRRVLHRLRWDADRFSEEDLPGAEPRGLTALQRASRERHRHASPQQEAVCRCAHRASEDVNAQPFRQDRDHQACSGCLP